MKKKYSEAAGGCGCPHGCGRKCDEQGRCPFCWNGGKGCPVLFHGGVDPEARVNGLRPNRMFRR